MLPLLSSSNMLYTESHKMPPFIKIVIIIVKIIINLFQQNPHLIRELLFGDHAGWIFLHEPESNLSRQSWQILKTH